MEYILNAKDKVTQCYQYNPKLSVALLTGLSLYALKKVHNVYIYKQKQFKTASEISNNVILITGCGHGFGHDLALQLSIDHGYRVIATCRTQQSADEFLSNSQYTANKSTAIIMDVTNDKHIDDTKQFVINYLDETSCTLWGIVNNAGLGFVAPFEICPAKIDKLQRDVLLNGPINIIRAFLPLLHGRKNFKPKDDAILTMRADGGRIVNVSSAAARTYLMDARYGPSKAAISYLTHSLRFELSPLFGIWCSAIEPGGFKTNVIETGVKWAERITKELKEDGKEELLDIYKYDVDILKGFMRDWQDKSFNPSIQPVLDDIIHALTAKHPKQEYVPGGTFMLAVMENVPLSVLDYFYLMQQKMFVKMIKNIKK